VIELDVAECGVALIIEIRNVKQRSSSASDEGKSMRAQGCGGNTF
jgi:hypothetical protein